MHGIAENITVTNAMIAEDLSATTNGEVIDTQGFDGLAFSIHVGANTGNAFDATHNLTFTVQNDDNSGFTSGSALAASEYKNAKDEDSNAWDRILDEAADDEKVYLVEVEIDPAERYYRLTATEAGTVTTVDVYAQAILFRARHAPS